MLDELFINDAHTQRDLSKGISVALGLLNSYLKNLVAKGYITVKTIPPKRCVSYLTPRGFTKKLGLPLIFFRTTPGSIGGQEQPADAFSANGA